MHAAIPKPRKLTARQIAKRSTELREMISSYALSHGASKGVYREWSFPTLIGNLEVDVAGDWLACCWDDVQRAIAHFKNPMGLLNPYSGKWNWGCGERLTAIELFTAWERAMNPLLAVNQEHAGCTHSEL